MQRRFWTSVFGRHKGVSSPPGPTEILASPVPWISDLIWSHWRELRMGAGISEASETLSILRDPRLYIVTRDDMRRAPVASIEQPHPVTPAWKQYDDNLQELQLLSGDFVGVRDPSWPMCCGRLATLINEQGAGRSLASIEAETGPLDLAYMEMEIWHDWCPRNLKEVEQAWQTGWQEALKPVRECEAFGGGLLFQCHACGRIYVGSCTP